MSKGTTIISDLRSFFSDNSKNRANISIIYVMEHINICSSQVGTQKKENHKFTNVQVQNHLMLFPFFVVRASRDWSATKTRKSLPPALLLMTCSNEVRTMRMNYVFCFAFRSVCTTFAALRRS